VSGQRFDRASVAALLTLAAERLVGEWLLVGGAVAAAWFHAERVTEDVDLIGLAGTNDERFALMELAVEAGLPVEAVNSAADFYVRRIADWRDEIVPFVIGRATIYRPTATLFVLLKLARLSESDLGDCLALLATDEPIDAPRIAAALAALPETVDAALAERRARLARTLDPT
jgi:hypothetical protein